MVSLATDGRPPVTDFGPNMWGDTFTSYSVDDQLQAKYAEAIGILKEEARKMLIVTKGGTTIDKIMLIDTLERLGVAYHFVKEIEEQLQIIYEYHSNSENGSMDCQDLFSVALEFRLLRQHRHHVSIGVFDKFKDKDNKFGETMSCDVEGLLSLYEAAQVRINGEEILDEGVAFATLHLNRMLPKLESPLRDKVKRALEQSFHRGIPRIETRNYISLYELDDKKNELLLKFAKLDFNYLQNVYKKELCDLSRWWNKFELRSKSPFIRDRIVESYVWGLGFHFEPEYSYVRTVGGMLVQLVAVLDDTYDNYATLDEAQLLADILERWDVDAVDPLPDCMKSVYKYVLSTYKDIELEASKQQKSYIMPYAIDTVKELCRTYMKELKWFVEGTMPTFEEYLETAVITGAVYMMFLACFIGMRSASSQVTDWLLTRPQIAVAAGTMGRWADNLGTCERENKEGQVLTPVESYMKLHGVSKEETLAKFVEKADDSWKDLNTEIYKVDSSIPNDVVDLFLNYSRVAEVTYKKLQDGYTHPEVHMAPQMAAILVDTIPIVL